MDRERAQDDIDDGLLWSLFYAFVAVSAILSGCVEHGSRQTTVMDAVEIIQDGMQGCSQAVAQLNSRTCSSIYP